MDRQTLGTAQVIRANSRDLPLADNSVDLVVTSPPYFALRSYQDGGEHYAGQIGDEPTPAEFVDSLLEVTRECVRVLKPSGSLWVNLGDKYAGSVSVGTQNGNIGVRGNRNVRTLEHGRGKIAQTDVRAKSLIGIPWRYALRCIDDLGLILRAEVIWSKPNGLPESVTDRVRRSHEQWFHFTLSPRYYSAVDEIREATKPHPWGDERRSLTRQRDADAAPSDATNMRVGVNPLGKLPGSVWTIPTEPLQVPDHLGIDHFAAFPTEWPRRIIQGWSPAGVCVECGEGRRPVVSRGSGDYGQQYPNFREAARLIDKHGFSRQELRALGTSGWAKWKAAGAKGKAPDLAPLCMRIEALLGGYAECAIGVATGTQVLTGYECACPEPTAPTTPGVVLDPFGGTGTTAMVAKALGRHGISVDMSADYCRLATWRTNDPKQLAKAARRPFTPSEKPLDGQGDLLDLLGEATA